MMLLNPYRFAASGGGGGGGATVTDGLVLHLDPASYSSGQVWANSVASPADGAAQTDHDYGLGSTTGSADSNDPTHAGSYWLFGGDDYFTAARQART